jgi:hypothetical protein
LTLIHTLIGSDPTSLLACGGVGTQAAHKLAGEGAGISLLGPVPVAQKTGTLWRLKVELCDALVLPPPEHGSLQ